MDEFSDEDIQLSIESDEDTRFTLTVVSTTGKKISMGQLLLTLELYLKDVSDAEEERNLMGAKTQ